LTGLKIGVHSKRSDRSKQRTGKRKRKRKVYKKEKGKETSNLEEGLIFQNFRSLRPTKRDK